MLMNRLSKHSLSASMALTAFLAVASMTAAEASANVGGKAGKSTSMVVDPEFNFSTHRTLQLDISVTDDKGVAQGHSMVRIFSLLPDAADPDKQNQQQQEKTYSLMAIASTDEAGWLTMPLDVPSHVTQLKLVVDQVGVENSRHVTLDDRNLVSVLF